jgi:TRAP-type C4-dicarboxylate transport system permease large subunit
VSRRSASCRRSSPTRRGCRGVIGLIIGFVGAFGWVLTYSKFPFVVAEAIAAIAPQWWLFIMLVIVLY